VRQLSDGTYSVYLLKDGKAHAQGVKVGRWLGTDWIITEGLKPGDVLITNQQQRLKDKLPVQAATSSGS
jgi:membrane fusion protein (multidrug efflux system)